MLFRNLFLFCLLFILTPVLFSCSDQSIRINGTVQNGIDGTPIANAIVNLDGTDRSTQTNRKGEFVINIPENLQGEIVVKKIKTGVYLIPQEEKIPLTLTVEKEQYSPLTYTVSYRLNDLTIGIIPLPENSVSDYYTNDHLPSTQFMEDSVNWENIIDGVRLFHENLLNDLTPLRGRYWNRDVSSAEAYTASIESNRRNFRSLLGAVDEREPTTVTKTGEVAETDTYRISEIQWTVLKEIEPRPPLQNWPELDVPTTILGEGLLLEPKETPKGFVIAI